MLRHEHGGQVSVPVSWGIPMFEVRKNMCHSRLTYGLADLIWLTTAVAVGCACAIQSIWIVGVLVWAMMIVFWVVRRRRYAAVPGAAMGVFIAWAILPITADAEQLLVLTALGATVGASFNAMILRYYWAGLFGLAVVLTVFIISVIVG